MEMSYVTIKARISDASDPADRRRTSRFSIEIDAKVRELGNEGCEARLINISETGFMAESDGEFEVGTRIWLILPGRERANALVRWIAGDKMGAEFAEPISLDGIQA
jgi:PilZ domain